MDLLAKLLGHDSWTTLKLLEICLTLTDDQLNQEFDIGHRTVRRTLDHMIWNIECWTDLMNGVIVRQHSEESSIHSLSNRFEAATDAFHTIARKIVKENRFEDCFLDHLDGPPREKTFSGAILHIVTHSMHHRAQLLYMLRRLGVDKLPEGDVLSWEQAMKIVAG